MLRLRRSADTKLALVCCAGAWLAFAPGRVAAQALRGEVFDAATQARLPYSMVTLTPGFPQRFTDDSGVFVSGQLQPGTYRLLVRHIGYQPLDTAVVLERGHALVLRIGLRPLAFELPPVTVTAAAGCVNPGPPNAGAAPQLAAMFNQLRENAERHRLLARNYPYRYWIERRYFAEDTARIQVDTPAYDSDNRVSYRTGWVVLSVRGKGRKHGAVLNLPTITDLADQRFHKAHCFSFGGIERYQGAAQLRMDFQAAAKIKASDVDGTAWLDSATYQLRRVTLSLTQPARVDPNLESVVVTMLFAEILPSLVEANQVVSVRTTKTSASIEEHRLLHWEFLRGGPTRQ